MTFLCSHWSFMWLYDDILIKAISHRVGTVIKNIPTPSGVITSLLQHTKKGRGKEVQTRGRRIEARVKRARLFQEAELLRKNDKN